MGANSFLTFEWLFLGVKWLERDADFHLYLKLDYKFHLPQAVEPLLDTVCAPDLVRALQSTLTVTLEPEPSWQAHMISINSEHPDPEICILYLATVWH
jgi:hypothetical protein